MKTEEKLGKTLKELMVNEPIDTISVKRLSELCGINRQTFYYHFRDLYDLLTWIFLNEQVENIDKANSWNDIFVSYLNYVEMNYIFIQNSLNSSGAELVKNFLFEGVYSKFLRILSYSDTDNVLSVDEKKFIARYHASGTLIILSSWVAEGMRESKDVVISRFSATASTDKIIKEFAEIHKGR